MQHQLKTRLDREKIASLTDRLLAERQNDLKRLLDIDHRLETVATLDGVEWINDSKSTTIEACRYSLQCIENEVVWILEAGQRYDDMSALRGEVGRSVRAMIYIGSTDDALVEGFVDLVDVVVQSDSLDEAMGLARELAESGESVLFSPACTSDHRYENYRERGEAFRALVGA